jgi:trehalose 6-phosphate phosphatase
MPSDTSTATSGATSHAFETRREPPSLDPALHALFLDFDGTFVDFAPTPDAIRLRLGSRELLERVSRRLNGALAIVSGRRIGDIDRYLAPLELPASGVHGQEFRPGPGDVRIRPATPEFDKARRRLSAVLAAGDPLLIEDKGGSLVVHYRLHPEMRGRAKALATEAISGLDDLYVVEGHFIFEIRQRDITKAVALKLFADVPAFRKRCPVFIGDDTTDEDGLRAAERAGGFGVKVGPGETEARYYLEDVTAVHTWLGKLVQRGS